MRFLKKIQADLYVMVNGDEPLVLADDIVKCIPESISEDGFYVSNLFEVVDMTNLKIVTNKDGVCLFISRASIPFFNSEMKYAYQRRCLIKQIYAQKHTIKSVFKSFKIR